MNRVTALERQYVMEVLDTDFRSSRGSMMTSRLEASFAGRFNSRFAIAFINGTATMHAALVAAGVKPGDEVIVPPLTMASTAFAVLHAGATPIFADIHPATWTLDPASVAARLTERSRAIIPVSIYGLAPDLDPLMQMANERGLFVLEDDAECFLGGYKGRIVGSIGHASSFSFQSSKQLTSGEGGMITTNDLDLANAIRRFNSLGYAGVGASKGKITRETIQDPNYERHVSVGFNYRMPELCAAVALAQLERMDELVGARVHAARLFAEATKDCVWLIPQAVPAGYVHSYWTWVVALSPVVDLSWYDFRAKFRELGGDGIYAAWRLNYLESAFRGQRFSPEQSQEFAPGLCPIAESLQPRLLQFKTNYWDSALAEKQAEILRRTIFHFGA